MGQILANQTSIARFRNAQHPASKRMIADGMCATGVLPLGRYRSKGRAVRRARPSRAAVGTGMACSNPAAVVAREAVDSREPARKRVFLAIWARARACSAIPGDRNRTSPWSARAKVSAPVPPPAPSMMIVQTRSWRPASGQPLEGNISSSLRSITPAACRFSNGAPVSRRIAQTAAVMVKALVINRKITVACRKLIHVLAQHRRLHGHPRRPTYGTSRVRTRTYAAPHIPASEAAQDRLNGCKEVSGAAPPHDARLNQGSA
jgi:hypothetical protein